MSKSKPWTPRECDGAGLTDVIGVLYVGFVAGVHRWHGNQVEWHVATVDVVLDGQLREREGEQGRS